MNDCVGCQEREQRIWVIRKAAAATHFCVVALRHLLYHHFGDSTEEKRAASLRMARQAMDDYDQQHELREEERRFTHFVSLHAACPPGPWEIRPLHKEHVSLYEIYGPEGRIAEIWTKDHAIAQLLLAAQGLITMTEED